MDYFLNMLCVFSFSKPFKWNKKGFENIKRKKRTSLFPFILSWSLANGLTAQTGGCCDGMLKGVCCCTAVVGYAGRDNSGLMAGGDGMVKELAMVGAIENREVIESKFPTNDDSVGLASIENPWNGCGGKLSADMGGFSGKPPPGANQKPADGSLLCPGIANALPPCSIE